MSKPKYTIQHLKIQYHVCYIKKINEFQTIVQTLVIDQKKVGNALALALVSQKGNALVIKHYFYRKSNALVTSH